MRKAIVSARRKGESIRTIARRLNIGLATAHLWIRRAGERRLDRVDWSNHAPFAHFTCRSSKEIEDLVLTIRRELKESSALGEYIESFNGRWQAKVWARFHCDSMATVRAQSARYVAAQRRRCESRIDGAPIRRKFPRSWKLDLQAGPRGRIIFLRRTTEQGEANLLGHMFAVDSNWPHRLVRAEGDLDARSIGFYALRRREPEQRPLLASSHYRLPTKRFLDI